MTNAEARKRAEEIILHLKAMMELTEGQPRKLFTAINDILNEAAASRAGVTDPDQPLNTPWSLYDETLPELLRNAWLPIVLGLPATSSAELALKYDKDYTDGEDIPKVRRHACGEHT